MRSIFSIIICWFVIAVFSTPIYSQLSTPIAQIRPLTCHFGTPEIVNSAPYTYAGVTTTLALNSLGHRLVVLENHIGGLRAFLYHPGIGWDGGTQLETDNGTAVKAFLDSQGRAMVIWWNKHNPNPGIIYAKRFDGSTWQNSPTLLTQQHSDNYGLIDFDADMDNNGNVMVVIYPLAYRLFNATTATWSEVTYIHVDGNQSSVIDGRRIRFDAQGRAIILFKLAPSLFTGPQLFAAHYNPTQGIYAIRNITISYSVYNFDLAMNRQGDAIAVFTGYSSAQSINNTYSYSYNVTSDQWSSTALPVGIPFNGFIGTVRVTLNDSGYALAAITQTTNSSSARDLVGNAFDANLGNWGTPQLLENLSDDFSLAPVVAMSSRGYGFIRWSPNINSAQRFTTQFTPGNGFTLPMAPPQPLDTVIPNSKGFMLSGSRIVGSQLQVYVINCR